MRSIETSFSIETPRARRSIDLSVDETPIGNYLKLRGQSGHSQSC
jgi:hypothetical protein